MNRHLRNRKIAATIIPSLFLVLMTVASVQLFNLDTRVADAFAFSIASLALLGTLFLYDMTTKNLRVTTK